MFNENMNLKQHYLKNSTILCRYLMLIIKKDDGGKCTLNVKKKWII